VDNELVLKVPHGQGNLPQVVPRLDLSDPLSPLDKFVHGLGGGRGTWLVHSSRMM